MKKHDAPKSSPCSQVEEVSPTLPPWTETRVVGKPYPRVDAYDRVSGKAVFPRDVSLPRMLHAAVLRCPYPHAIVKRVETGAAERMPGVCAVLTKDHPETAVVIPYPWWVTAGPPLYLFDQHCRYAGEEVAAVAAETSYQAWDALRAIQVEYEQLPFNVDMERALERGIQAVHEGGNLVREPSLYHRGDIAKGFAEADAVVEEEFRTSCEVHTPMETHGCVAQWDGNRLTVWESSQGIFDQQRDLARALSLPLGSVRIIGHYMGGGFGGKAELSKHTVIAALLARRSGRPVRLFLTREEAFLSVGNRPPHKITVKAGARKDGTLTALEFVSRDSVGAYSDSALGGALAQTLYMCPNVRIEESEVYVNAGKCRAMRAPGFPPAAWALEQAMDSLAEKIGMDPVDLRLKNILDPRRVPGSPLTSSGLRECLTEGARAFDWVKARARAHGEGPVRRGVGVAACLWGIQAGPPGTVVLKMLRDGSVNLSMGASDIGTGTKTVMAMVVSEELGLSMERIRIEHADTATTPYAQVSGGSHTVAITAPAVRAAAASLRAQVLELASEEMGVPAAMLVINGERIDAAGDPGRSVPLADLKGLAQREELVAIGNPDPVPAGKSVVSFAAHFAEVEVNLRTGEIRVIRFLAAHDSGRAMNLLTYRNQVFGGVTMGIGFALTEERVMDLDTGKVVNANLSGYKIATAADVPVDFRCLPIDSHDTLCNSVGAKGLGEPATVPAAPAIANALFHATGIRVTHAPVTPARMLRLLARVQK